jgi:hypothetical protein
MLCCADGECERSREGNLWVGRRAQASGTVPSLHCVSGEHCHPVYHACHLGASKGTHSQYARSSTLGPETEIMISIIEMVFFEFDLSRTTVSLSGIDVSESRRFQSGSWSASVSGGGGRVAAWQTTASGATKEDRKLA